MSKCFNPNFNRSKKPSVCFGCDDRKQKEERVFMQNYKMEQKRRR